MRLIEKLNIGILSKRKTMLAGNLKDCLEKKGNNVSIYTLENLVINKSLLNHDFYILKSKSLFFLYAGFFLEANNKIVIPNPQTSFMLKNRIQSHFLMKKVSFFTPDIYLGTIDTFRNQLDEGDFPFILKPIMGSGSKGVKLIKNFDDLKSQNNGIIYMEKFIRGTHYNVYFIGNEICTLIKPPLSNEHVDMRKVNTPLDIKDLLRRWIKYFDGELLFGHLDIVKEESTNNLYVVDPGSFPEFVHTPKCEIEPTERICNLIITKYEKTLKI
ncbi:MAG: RimK family alpha-L-glutamate ligase [Candidatus Hermodarchaeota archaeon]